MTLSPYLRAVISPLDDLRAIATCKYIAIPDRFGPIQNQPRVAQSVLDGSGKCQGLDIERRMFVTIGQGRASSSLIRAILAIKSSGPETAA
jgi:hypothetical protein